MPMYLTSRAKFAFILVVALGAGCLNNQAENHAQTSAGANVSKDTYVSACAKDKFCESILEVHYPNCARAAARVAKGLTEKENYASFSSCVNESSGYQLLKVSYNGRLIANQIEH